MKTLPALAATVLLAASSLALADSKRTAEYLLIDPKSHVEQEVTLDVSLVKPVHWKSPLDEVSFFHALTIDRTDDKFGGAILVAVPSEDAAKFAKKYGMDFEGRNSTTTLRGTFLLVGGRGPSGFWIVDTTGKLMKLIAEKKIDLPADADKAGDVGPGFGRGPRHPRRPH
jgi:hypothetical protein